MAPQKSVIGKTFSLSDIKTLAGISPVRLREFLFGQICIFKSQNDGRFPDNCYVGDYDMSGLVALALPPDPMIITYHEGSPVRIGKDDVVFTILL